MASRTIPIVDLEQYVEGNPQDQKEFVDQIGSAFHTVGFVDVKNHGVPKECSLPQTLGLQVCTTNCTNNSKFGSLT